MLIVWTSKAIYEPGEPVDVELGTPADQEVEVILDSSKGVIERKILMPGDSGESLTNPGPGMYEVVVSHRGGRIRLPILVRERGEPVKLVLVFHNHQPVHKYPTGIYHGPWAFHHVWSPELMPSYEYGPYLLHAELLRKYRLGITYNLSPSLLLQWEELLSRGVLLDGGDHLELITPWSPRARLIEEALKIYSTLAREGIVDILTSFLAHPIAGYLEDWGIGDLLRWELRMGMSVTRRILGIDPRGAWLPEMYYSREVRDILCSEGIEYTVLDAVYHLAEMSIDPYRPYRLGCLTVFFRDTALSDMLSFHLNKASSPNDAEHNARLFVIEAARRRGTVTVALDGENWMVLPKPNPHAATMLMRIFHYLSTAQRDGYIEVMKMSPIDDAEELPKEPPNTSWLGSSSKWTLERRDVQEVLWGAARSAVNHWRIYEEVFGENEELRMAVAMAIDSDYYWAEFVNPNHINEWAGFVVREVNDELSKLSIVAKDGEVSLVNMSNRSARLIVIIDGRETRISMEPNSRVILNGKIIEALTPITRRRIIKVIIDPPLHPS